MLAEIITIGDELLIGQVVDTNSAFIASELNKVGVSIFQITSIQDDKKHILTALKNAENRVDIIIITGGLGPTKDDITKKTIAEYFDDTLKRNAQVLENIKTLWEKEVRKPLLQVNIDQALVPSKATVLMNTSGTAPGMWLEKDSKTFISLPGVPFEMRKLMLNEVLPKIKTKYNCPFILHKTLLVSGIGESALSQRIEAWEEALPEDIALAYLPKLGNVRLRLSSKGENKEHVINEVEEQIEKLLPLIEEEFVCFEEEGKTIEAIIGKYLAEKNKSLAVAESCTGGKIAEKFTKNPGASAYFRGGIVTYSTESKINVLGVSGDIIEKHSVVSVEVVEEMAKNVRALFNADYGLATTGNAGPTKGDSNAEVGTVYIGISTKKNMISAKFSLGTERKRVTAKAVNKALEILEKEILKN